MGRKKLKKCSWRWKFYEWENERWGGGVPWLRESVTKGHAEGSASRPMGCSECRGHPTPHTGTIEAKQHLCWERGHALAKTQIPVANRGHLVAFGVQGHGIYANRRAWHFLGDKYARIYIIYIYCLYILCINIYLASAITSITRNI